VWAKKRVRSGCTSGEYDLTIRARQRCGFVSNYFDRLFSFTAICFFLQFSHLLHFYITVIRPVLEYCAPVWHYALMKAQSESLEAV